MSHVVVCGQHDDARRVVEQLEGAGVPVSLVEDRPDEETLWRVGLGDAIALVCIGSDDLDTLATALLARELRDDLRIVVSLSNPAVGRAVGDVGVAVLDAATIAAPSVVEACLQTEGRPLPVGQGAFHVVHARPARQASLRELYGDLAPLAVVRGADVEVRPGRDRRVDPDDTVVLVGVDPDDAAATRAQPAANVGARTMRESGPRQMNVVRYAFRRTDRRIKLALAALASLAAVSVTVLMIGYRDPDGSRMSVLDALYFTVETIGTVGFGDFFFREQQSWLRVWAIILMVVGATLAATFFALLTNALVSRTLGRSYGQRRITGLADHVVVVGLGAVGIAVVEGLVDRGVEVVVVETDEHNRFLDRLRALEVPVVIADATVAETWRSVRLREARAVAVMTSDDLANIETGLAVRDLLGERWADVPVVLRIFDRRLAATVERGFGFHHVRSPSALAAPWFVGAALGLDIVQTLYAAGRPMLVARLAVPDELVGTTMSSLAVGTLVVGLRRADGGVVDLPRRETTFGPGDVATLIGPHEELLRLLLG